MSRLLCTHSCGGTNLLLVLVLLSGLGTGCEKHPVNRLANPTTANTTGVWGDTWVVYDDEVKTNGDIQAMTDFSNQILDFNSTDHPQAGTTCIKMSWDGSSVYWYSESRSQIDFVGFIFKVQKEGDPSSPVTKDLTAAGYTKISFWARGTLAANMYLRLEGDRADYKTPSGTNAWMSDAPTRRITDTWQYFEFPISGSLAAVADFVRIVLRYDVDGNPDTPNSVVGNGGTVYIDNIQLRR